MFRNMSLMAVLAICSVATAIAAPSAPPAVPEALMGFRTSEGVICNTTPTLRLAIEDLITTFGKRYPQGPAFLERLALSLIHI